MTDIFKKTFSSYASNSFKNLAEKCIENISSAAGPTKTYLIYPSNEVKDFFIQSFLEKNLHVFGIRFTTLQQFIHLSLKICYKKDLLFPSHYELMFFLEEKISILLNSSEEHAKPLQDYIGNKKERIISLSSNLSHTFLEYMLYGKNALPEWREIDGWQQILFNSVLKRWTCISNAIEHLPSPPFPLSVHLFVVDEIPPLYIECLSKLSSQFTFTVYFFSPSPLFWGDLISRKKSAYIDKLFQKKHTSIEERIEFADFSKKSHPLLSHFCDVGKPLYTLLHENGCTEDYSDIEMHSDLSYVQKALLYQIKPENPPFKDGSFSLHKAPSLLREIEITVSNIQATLHKNPHLNPADIAVLAPDIDLYFPFIAYLFAGSDYPFSYTISNLKKIRHSESLNAIFRLISLVDSRFEKDDVIKLFKSPFFQRRCQVSEEDLDVLSKIIDHTGIRWGFDSKSKSLILDEEKPCSFGLFDKGFSHILDLITEKDSPVEFSQVESIGDIIFLVQSLHKDILGLVRQKYTLHTWLTKTTEFVEKYLYIDDDAEFFFKELRKVSSLSKTSSYPVSFESFKRLYGEIFAKKGAWEKNYEKPPITFSSIESSPPINKTLFFIGLDEESYPKKDTIRSLNELSCHPLYDKKKSPSKNARYYLLKAICSANTAISLSYTSNNPIDGKERNPSPLLDEIIHALCLDPPVQHPFIPYSSSYFTSSHVLKKNYDLHMSSGEKIASPFTFKKEEDKKRGVKTIAFKEFSLLARSPSQFFYNLSTNLYENTYLSPTLFDDSEFILSYLDKAIIKRKKVKENTVSFDALIKTNKLPAALFEKAAEKELIKEIRAEKTLFMSHFKTNDPYMSIHLDPHIKSPIYSDDKMFLPAATIKFRDCIYTIEGTIPNLTKKGLVSFKKSSPAEIWKLIPTLIILSHLDTEIPLTINFLNEDEEKTFNKESLKPLIMPLLSYYEKALENISPLVPEAIGEYLSKNAIAFANLKTKLLTRFHDPYLEKGEPHDYTHFEEELQALSSIIKGGANARI